MVSTCRFLMEGSCSITLTLEALLDLSSGAAILEEEISVLRPLFWLSPDFENVVPPSVNAPEPRRSKRVMSITGYYATLAGMGPGEGSQVDS